jgi:hypothetical protein
LEKVAAATGMWMQYALEFLAVAHAWIRILVDGFLFPPKNTGALNAHGRQAENQVFNDLAGSKNLTSSVSFSVTVSFYHFSINQSSKE